MADIGRGTDQEATASGSCIEVPATVQQQEDIVNVLLPTGKTHALYAYSEYICNRTVEVKKIN